MSVTPLNIHPTPFGSEVKRALRTAFPILVALAPLAMVLGAQAAQKGFGSLHVALMTALNFAGGSEFAAVGMWTSPVPVFLIVAMTFLVNSRHLLMGAALSPYIRHLPRRVVYPALFFMVDESWALALSDARQRVTAGTSPSFSLTYYMTISLALWVAWFSFAVLGARLGPVLGDLGRWGFEMAFPAIFLVLIRSMWTTWRAARSWACSLAVAAGVHLLIPGAWYVPAGAIAGLMSAYFLTEHRQ